MDWDITPGTGSLTRTANTFLPGKWSSCCASYGNPKCETPPTGCYPEDILFTEFADPSGTPAGRYVEMYSKKCAGQEVGAALRRGGRPAIGVGWGASAAWRHRLRRYAILASVAMIFSPLALVWHGPLALDTNVATRPTQEKAPAKCGFGFAPTNRMPTPFELMKFEERDKIEAKKKQVGDSAAPNRRARTRSTETPERPTKSTPQA